MKMVCPTCEVIMHDCYDPSDSNEEDCWQCPNCSETWTAEEIQQAYEWLDDMRDTENRGDNG